MESALREGGREPGLRLIETMRWDGAGVPRLDLHAARMAAGARALGWPVPDLAGAIAARLRAGADTAGADAAGAIAVSGGPASRGPARLEPSADATGAIAAGGGPVPGGPARLRATADADGVVRLEVRPMPVAAAEWRVGLAAGRLASDDPWLAVKSTRRAAYDAARAEMAPGFDEVIFLNERGEVCDGSITTVFFDRGQGLRTPPLSCGLLPGVLRAGMACPEEVLRAEDLGAVRLWVGNALRGLMRAVWAGDDKHPV